MRVKFQREAKYVQNDPAQCRTYESGKEYDLSDDHAHRWIRRGYAVKVEKEIKAKPIEVEAPKVETPKSETKSK